MKVLILSLIALCGLSLVEGVILTCKYKTDSLGYRCKAQSWKITSKNDRTITQVNGQHLSGKGDSDVKYFESDGHVLKFFPLGLAAKLLNLEIVEIQHAALGGVNSSDLQQFGGKLKTLLLYHNVIEHLEANLFKFNPNLKEISFKDNKIRQIEDEAFKGLDNLKRIHIQGPCIDKSASTRTDVIFLISQAEFKCKDYAVMLKNLERTTQAQLIAKTAVLEAQISALNENLFQQKATFKVQFDKTNQEMREIEVKYNGMMKLYLDMNAKLLQLNTTTSI